MEKCLAEKRVKTPGHLVVTVHVCGLEKGHKSSHRCRKKNCCKRWMRTREEAGS